MDHYYTKVIQTFVKIFKRNTSGRKIVLVNMAKALKYLEAYRQRQSQLFAVLEILSRIAKLELISRSLLKNSQQSKTLYK